MATKSPNDNFLNDYESIEVIGQGSFGKIRKVRRKRDGMVSIQLATLYQLTRY